MNNKKTVRLAKMGMLVAISVVLAYFVHFPIIPGLNFLEYDPADISIFIGTFAFGPLGGIALTVVTSLIQGLTVSAGSGAYGIIMHIIATGTFVLVAGNIYRTAQDQKRRYGGSRSGNCFMGCSDVLCKPFHYPAVYGSYKRCCNADDAAYPAV